MAQEYEYNGKKILMPVSWFSRTLNKHEVNYPVRELEALAIVETFKKFEYLLLGSPFTVACKTDHNTLRQVQQGGELTNKRLARWQEYLGGFTYAIEYIPGKENYLADGVSRSLNGFGSVGLKKLTDTDNHITIPVVSAVAATYDNRLDDLNYGDSTEFKDVWSILDTNTDVDYLFEPSVRYFEKIGNKLYHKNSDGTLSLCVPEGHRLTVDGFKSKLPLREILIMECHDSPYMGHRGIVKTTLQVSKLFYWKGLPSMVAKYVASCRVCARAKASSRGDVTSLAPNEAPLGPMHSISIDFMAGLPEVRGVSKVLVIVDRFSKKVFTIPTSDSISTSELLVKLHDTIFREHGYPLEIISDRDTLFTSKIWVNLFKTVGTKLSHSYSYHQRFDGQTEVMNRVLKEVLRSYSNFEQTNWLDNLPDTVQCLNNSLNPTHGMTANEVYFGRRLLTPIDLKYGIQQGFEGVAEFCESVSLKREIALKAIRQAICRYASSHKTKHSSSSGVDPRFKIGNFVMVKADNITQPGFSGRASKKLGSKNVGPFKIVERVSRTGFKLHMPGYPHHKLFHVNALIPYSLGMDLEIRVDQSKADHTDLEGEDFYQVEKLEMRAIKRGKTFYFVVYTGYPIEDGEWHSRDDLLQDCPSLVTGFDAEADASDKPDHLTKTQKATLRRSSRTKAPPHDSKSRSKRLERAPTYETKHDFFKSRDD